jgi:sugar lactone lactonase YvrE
MALQCVAVGCASTPPVNPFASSGAVWPAPPDAPRITFVTEFAGSSDLGIRKSAWARLINLAVGGSEDRMSRPMAIAATLDGSVVYVADPDAHCVHRYDLERGRYKCLAAADESVISPIGLAVTNAGHLYVSDSQHGRLLQMAQNGKELVQFNVDVTLEQPTGLCWDEHAQRLLVTDTMQQLVVAVDAQGQHLATLGERGNSAGQFNFPTYLWLDRAGELLVTDSLNFRMQRFDSQRNFLSMFGRNGDQPGDFARPKGVAVDTFGHVYVIDALFHAMLVFDRDGRLLLSVGRQGQDAGEFWLPSGIFVTADNTIFVADSYNKRVQVFRYVGTES